MRKGQNVRLQVRAPSGELFYITLEPVLEDEMPMMPKQGLGAMTAMGDVESYNNWQDENSKEAARVAIHTAAERARDPRNYPGSSGYSNLVAIEHGVGSSNPKMAQKQKEAGIL